MIDQEFFKDFCALFNCPRLGSAFCQDSKDKERERKKVLTRSQLQYMPPRVKKQATA